MKPEEIRKLVGGYAAGILTAEERRLLFEAALSDQTLFDELANEQALKDLLDDPAARGQLLAALEDKPSPWAWLAGLYRRPAAWGVASGLAAAAVLVTVLVWPPQEKQKTEPVLTAMKSGAPAVPQAAPEQAPAKVKDSAPAVEAEAAKAVIAIAPKEMEAKSLLLEKGQADALEAPPPMPVTRASAAPKAPEPRNEVSFARQTESPAAGARRKVAAQEADAKAAATGGVVGGISGGFAGGAVGGILPMSKAVGADAGTAATPIPYRLELADAESKWAPVAVQSGFRKEDRLRVVFEAKQAGRLRVESSSGGVLLDQDVEPGVPVNLAVPADESKLTGSFRSVPFEIAIRRVP